MFSGYLLVDIFKGLQDYCLARIIATPIESLIIEHELNHYHKTTPTFAGFLVQFCINFL